MASPLCQSRARRLCDHAELENTQSSDCDRTKIEFQLTQNVCYALSKKAEQLHSLQACTLYGSKISRNIIRVAASRIFADPIMSFFELISNAIDSYGEVKIGRFGLGFFSILGMLQSKHDEVIIESRNHCYHISLDDSSDYTVRTSEIPTMISGTIVMLMNRNLTANLKGAIMKTQEKLHKKFAYFNRDYDIRFRKNDEPCLSLNRYSDSRSTLECPHLVNIRHSTRDDVSCFSVCDYSSTGMQPEDVYNLMLVPSSSSKKLERGALKILKQRAARIIDIKSGYGRVEYYVTCGGITVKHDIATIKTMYHSLMFHLAFPVNMPLVVSRDDFLTNEPEARQVYQESIRHLILETYTVRPDGIGSLITGLEMYAQTTVNELLIRLTISDTIKEILLHPTLIIPSSIISRFLGEYLSRIGKRYVALTDRSYEEAREFFIGNLSLVRHYVGITALELPVSNGFDMPHSGGFIDLIFAPQGYTEDQFNVYETRQSMQTSLILVDTNLAKTVLDSVKEGIHEIRKLYPQIIGKDLENLGQLIYRYALLHGSSEIYPDSVLWAIMCNNTGSYFGSEVKTLTLRFHRERKNNYYLLLLCILDFLMIKNEHQRMEVISRYISNVQSTWNTVSTSSTIYLTPLAITASVLPTIYQSDYTDYIPDYDDCMEMLEFSTLSEHNNIIPLPVYNTQFQSSIYDTQYPTKTSDPIYGFRSTETNRMYCSVTFASRHFLERMIFQRTGNTSLILDDNYSYKYAVVYSSCLLIVHERISGMSTDSSTLEKIKIEFLVRYSERICQICHNTSFRPIHRVKRTTPARTYFEVRILRPMLDFARILVSTNTSPPRTIPQRRGEIQGEFYVTQLINLLAREEIDINAGEMGSAYLLAAADAPKGMELQSLQIALRSGTNREYFNAALTELLQNSIDAIRQCKSEDHRIEVETDGYSYTIADTVGIDPTHIPGLLIPFLSTKECDASTGEMGSGFYSILREDITQHVDIVTIHSGRSLRLRLRVDGDDVHVTWKIDSYKGDKGGTRIIVFLAQHTNFTSYVARINEYARSFLPVIDTTCKFNGKIVSDGSVRVVVDNPNFRILVRNMSESFVSPLLTNGVPFGYLDDYIEVFGANPNNTKLRTLLARNLILDIKKTGYRPVQSRNHLILEGENLGKEILLSLATKALSRLSAVERSEFMGSGFEIFPEVMSRVDMPLFAFDTYNNNGKHGSEKNVGYLFYDSVIEDLRNIVEKATKDSSTKDKGLRRFLKIYRGLVFHSDSYIQKTDNPILKSVFSDLWICSDLVNRKPTTDTALKETAMERKQKERMIAEVFPHEAMKFYQHVVNVYWKKIVSYKDKHPDNPMFRSFCFGTPPKLLYRYDLDVAYASAYYTKTTHSITLNAYRISRYPYWKNMKALLMSCYDSPSNLPVAININSDRNISNLFGMNGLRPGTLWHELLHAVLSITGEHADTHQSIRFGTVYKTFDEMIQMAISYAIEEGNFFSELLSFF